MQVKNGLVAAAIVGFTIALTHVAAQGPPPPQTPPGGAPQTPTPPGGRGQGRGRAETFPAQQRPPGVATAGGLVFAGDAGGNIVAHDAATGKPLWHSRIGSITNAPQTYRLDGRQYLLVATGDTLYAFVLY